MKQARLSVVLLCCVTLFAGCGARETTPNSYAEDTAPQKSDSAPAEEAPEAATEKTTRPKAEVPISRTKDDGTSDIHVTVQSIEISLSDLKAQNYIVPLYISLDENSGISYSEWGASYDPRCTAEAIPFDDEVRFDTVFSVNDDMHFLWTAWSSSVTRDKGGNLLRLDVTLPEDASAGDSYYVNYEPYSLADMPHSWASADHDWVKDGYISWTDGGVTVTE